KTLTASVGTDVSSDTVSLRLPARRLASPKPAKVTSSAITRRASAMTRPSDDCARTTLRVPLLTWKWPRLWKATPLTVGPDGGTCWLTVTVRSSVAPSKTLYLAAGEENPANGPQVISAS